MCARNILTWWENGLFTLPSWPSVLSNSSRGMLGQLLRRVGLWYLLALACRCLCGRHLRQRRNTDLVQCWLIQVGRPRSLQELSSWACVPKHSLASSQMSSRHISGCHWPRQLRAMLLRLVFHCWTDEMSDLPRRPSLYHGSIFTCQVPYGNVGRQRSNKLHSLHRWSPLLEWVYYCNSNAFPVSCWLLLRPWVKHGHGYALCRRYI
jgi:hypothetical protein